MDQAKRIANRAESKIDRFALFASLFLGCAHILHAAGSTDAYPSFARRTSVTAATALFDQRRQRAFESGLGVADRAKLVRLKSRYFVAGNPDAKVLSSAGGGEFYILLSRTPRDEERDELEAAGVSIIDHVTRHVWRAEVNDLTLATAHPLVLGTEPVWPVDKLSHGLWLELQSNGAESDVDVVVMFSPAVGFFDARTIIAAAGGVTESTRLSKTGRVTVSLPRARVSSMAANTAVRFVSLPPPPSRAGNADAAAMSGVDQVRSIYGLTGAGVNVMVRDGGPVSLHPDFGSPTRINNVDTTHSESPHSTHVSGTIAGSGSGDPDAQGMAPSVVVHSYDWLGDDMDEFEDALDAWGARISNHSYMRIVGWHGTNWLSNTNLFGAYDEAADWDAAIEDRDLIVCKIAGNDRDDDGTGHPHDGSWDDDGYYDCIPDRGCAKNVITVGALKKTGSMVGFSGWGPADDGRVKPDVVACGYNMLSPTNATDYGRKNGTSMACPVVAGTCALLEEQATAALQVLPAATVKALILGTATDWGRTGPDYQSGWGLMNSLRAVETLRRDLGVDLPQRALVFEQDVDEGQAFNIPFFLEPDIDVARITIVWTDPAASPLAAEALIDDIDISVTEPDGVTKHYPYVMPYAQSGASRADPATTGTNRWDNVEQIAISNAVPGRWKLRIWGEYVKSLGGAEFSTVLDAPGAGKFLSSDLDVQIHPLRNSAGEDETITFDLVVYNQGKGVAEGVVGGGPLLPDWLSYVSHSGGTYDDVTGIWDIGTLPRLATATLRITGRVLVNTPVGKQISTLYVGTQGDTDVHDAMASTTVWILPRTASTLYVATNGVDIGLACTNPATPCATLTYAMSIARDDNVIEVAPGIYTEYRIEWSQNVRVRGAGADTTIIQAVESGPAYERVMFVPVGVTGVPERVTIRHGSAGTFGGGGISINGDLTMNECVVTDNVAWFGGGLISTGRLLLERCTIHRKQGLLGGGIYVEDGYTDLVNSTVSMNEATEAGGGMEIGTLGWAQLVNTTVASNSSVDPGGGLVVLGDVFCANTLIAGNSSNAPSGPDVSGTLFSLGYNLVENLVGCSIVGSPLGNLTGVDPSLGPLQGNGASTPTHALQHGSPAIDAGYPGFTPPPDTDQRGLPRVSGGRIDLGAYEMQNPGYPIAVFSFSPNPVAPHESISFDATASTHPGAYLGYQIVGYDWDLAGDGTFEGSAATPLQSHSYTTRGERIVRLRVRDDQGPPEYGTSARPVNVANILDGVEICNALQNPGFERSDEAPRYCQSEAWPSVAGIWQGDETAVVTNGLEGIAPYSGSHMLQLKYTGPCGPSQNVVCDVWQLIDLAFLSDQVARGQVTVRASLRANRVLGDLDTDRSFSLAAESHAGPMSAFPSGGQLLHSSSVSMVVDGDPASWQRFTTERDAIPPTATYLAIHVAATEDRANDQVAPELDGHYVDEVGVCLTVDPCIGSPAVSNGVMRFDMLDLTRGTSNWVERCFDLRSNDWVRLPGYMAVGSETNWSEQMSNDWNAVFYRMGYTLPSPP